MTSNLCAFKMMTGKKCGEKDRVSGMDEMVKKEISESIREFRLPGYDEIPDVGLYLEQTVKYISQFLEPLEMGLTGSMISNYVKKKLVRNPVRKQYDREQIAYLIFIGIVKSVLSMEDIRTLIRLQQETYPGRVAYDYFCLELENVLQHIFGLKPELETVGEDDTDEKLLLRMTIVAVAHKVFLDRNFRELSGSDRKQEESRK